jgi:hypothetical protein
LLFLSWGGSIGDFGFDVVDILEHFIVELIYFVFEETAYFLACEVDAVFVFDLSLLYFVEILNEVEDSFI